MILTAAGYANTELRQLFNLQEPAWRLGNKYFDYVKHQRGWETQ